MDTLTHFAAGACVGELLAGRRVGRAALVIGGVAQLIPDIDFVFGLWMTPAANAWAHRGITHSLLFLIAVAPVLGWLARRWWGDQALTWKFWTLFLGAEIAMHLLLDAFNAYGTGWFEPFSDRRISFHSMFVADPIFFTPLGIALLILALRPNTYRWRRAVPAVALSLCVAYLGYALFNKYQIDRAVRASFSSQGIRPEAYITTPTPLNSWLWYIVVNDSAGSHVAHRSIFDPVPAIRYEFFPRNDSLLSLTPPHNRRELYYLTKLSQGFYTVALQGDTLVFNDLRFGQMRGWQNPRAGFVFHYYLKPDLDNSLLIQRGRFDGWDRHAVTFMLRRMAGCVEQTGGSTVSSDAFRDQSVK